MADRHSSLNYLFLGLLFMSSIIRKSRSNIGQYIVIIVYIINFTTLYQNLRFLFCLVFLIFITSIIWTVNKSKS